jgi:hypothetical protein
MERQWQCPWRVVGIETSGEVRDVIVFVFRSFEGGGKMVRFGRRGCGDRGVVVGENGTQEGRARNICSIRS